MNKRIKPLLRKILTIVLFLLFGFCVAFSAKKSDFIMWQLPSQINTIGNSYVFLMNNGEVVVMDGGVKEEESYLRGFLAALGNHVSIWFVSHPHPDHIGALNEILKNPGQIKIDLICHSGFSPDFCKLEPDYQKPAAEFYESLKNSGIPACDLIRPGKVFQADKTKFKILCVKNESITTNPFNNSCMVVRAWDDIKSVVFLADAGAEEGDWLLKSPFRKDLDCDYLQMAHHGQNGVSKDFYRTISFKACLWPTPSWVYNNDIGEGFNTHILNTVEFRNLIDSLGIKYNYVSFKGLYKIENAVGK